MSTTSMLGGGDINQSIEDVGYMLWSSYMAGYVMDGARTRVACVMRYAGCNKSEMKGLGGLAL